MGKYGQGFAKIFFGTVIFVFLLSSTCFASKQEVLQFKAIVPVTGPETNATVSLERGSKVILDASEDAIAATYSWTYLGGSSAVTLLNRSLPTAYFWSDRPGVYQFSLQITQEDSISETRNVAVTVRDIHFIEITQPTEEERMRMATKPFAHPMEWIALGAMGVYGTGTLTTDKPVVDIEGFTGLYTTTLECKNLTTGAQYTVSSNINHGDYRLAFSFDGVVLQEGDNLIEVTGIDDFGTQCRDARFVTYNPGITYLTPLKLSPTSAYEGEDENVEFSLQIRVKEGETLPEKFDLYESTVSGELVQRIGELLPKGNPVQGFYSVMMNLPGGTKDRYYRAATGQSRKSITVEFVCLPRNAMSVESMNYTSEVIGAIKREVMSEGMIDGKVRMTEAELNRRMEAIAEKLNERDDVKYVRIHSRGEVLRVKFTTLGAETGFSIHRTILPEDDKESAPPDNDAPSSSTENNSVNSKKIVSLHPYEAQKGVGGHDLLYSVSPLITKYPHLLKEYRQIVNSDIRMEHYRNAIRDARLVFISTHGGTITVFSGVDATLHMSKLDGELSMERTSPFPASRFSAATTIPAYLGASIWAAWW